jgi:protein-arginine kinase activator protein McsA
MSNKEFYKKFEEILKEIFGDKNKPTTPIESFFDNVKYDSFTDDLGEWKRTIRTSKDGLFTSIQCVLDNGKKWSAPKRDEISELKNKLDICVANQEFEEAAKLRDQIKSLQSEISKIKTLKKEMEIAIKEQNFERAIEIRDELKKIN